MREQAKSLAGRFDLNDGDDNGDGGKADEDAGNRRGYANSVNVHASEQNLAQGDSQAAVTSPRLKPQLLSQFSLPLVPEESKTDANP